MTYQVAIDLHSIPDRQLLESMLEIVAEHNARWYTEHPDAPTPHGAGVRWVADSPSPTAIFEDAPILLGRRQGSCGPIAAAVVGYHRACERRAGMPPAATRKRHRVVLRPRGRHTWHAYHGAPWGVEDPSENL